MTIEQKPELNRYIDPTIPITCDYRKRALKIWLPLMIFLWVMGVEKVILHDSATHRFKWDEVPSVLARLGGGMLFLTVFILAMLELQIRLRHRSKRRLRILDKHLVLAPGNPGFIKWERIAKFQLSPVMGAPDLKILDIFTQKKSLRKPHRWAIVLDCANEIQELLGQLEKRKSESRLDFEIEILKEPMNAEPLPPVSMIGALIFVGGLILSFNGAMLFAVWIDLQGLPTPAPAHVATVGPFGRFVARHFSSRAEFIRFFLILSVSLIVASIPLLICGKRMHKRPSGPGRWDNQILPV